MRGFKDILPPESYKIQYIKDIFSKISKSYAADFIDLPIVEDASLYFRTSGADSDVCNKELFEVRKYKGEFENWVLRPEGTASCIRAIMEQNFMQENKFARFAYCMPMFRYNRPQKGRYRQFTQVGWEFLGSSSPGIDFELIQGAIEFIKHFNLEFTLEINSIGSKEDRKKYREILSKHFQTEKDPLKILDKLDEHPEVNPDLIPTMDINEKDDKHFQELLSLLDKNNIKYIKNPYLVRGLDYYNSTVFEIKEKNGQTILAGGRYDYLMQQLAKNSSSNNLLPAIGFSASPERLANYVDYDYVNQKIALIVLDSIEYGLSVAQKIRKEYDLGCFVIYELDLKKALAYASKKDFETVIIAGSQEKANNEIIIKNLKNRTEQIQKFDEVLSFYTLND